MSGELKPIHWHRKNRWSRAIPTHVGEIRFPSRMEARVYSYLIAHLRPEERLIRQASFPLLGLAPDAQAKVQRFTVDFIVVCSAVPVRSRSWIGSGEFDSVGGLTVHNAIWVRVVEAKGPRKSRDYPLRKAAFEAIYGRVWEWDGNGEPPWETLS